MRQPGLAHDRVDADRVDPVLPNGGPAASRIRRRPALQLPLRPPVDRSRGPMLECRIA